MKNIFVILLIALFALVAFAGPEQPLTSYQKDSFLDYIRSEMGTDKLDAYAWSHLMKKWISYDKKFSGEAGKTFRQEQLITALEKLGLRQYDPIYLKDLTSALSNFCVYQQAPSGSSPSPVGSGMDFVTAIKATVDTVRNELKVQGGKIDKLIEEKKKRGQKIGDLEQQSKANRSAITDLDSLAVIRDARNAEAMARLLDQRASIDKDMDKIEKARKVAKQGAAYISGTNDSSSPDSSSFGGGIQWQRVIWIIAAVVVIFIFLGSIVYFFRNRPVTK
ncbi:MAG: hypothetical protein V1707_02835 [bacterium]